ncbi:glycosyltransferase family 2 protein [Flavobacterium bomense]|uniref:Glycosyltransferase family 2 protein n=1 Tax=Flavobacterium bomense TaxID=2497483 RepID=A0A3S0UZR5_9FLAO|nr:glycosyltransferase family 2 protein [Flavobacterium bomense]RTZ06498.1 glycosyltransferase family 2 protein [Flavobacterium bomense]
MNNLPSVSVIIPTYNRSKLLLETLYSVKNQTLKNWECIIVDDGSNDNTEDIINNFIRDDIRFKFFKRPVYYPKGACSCRNYGFEISKGKFIQWLDDDDLLSTNKLELQVKKLEILDNPKIFTTCDWDLFWPNKKFQNNNLLQFKKVIKADSFFHELKNQLTFCPVHTFLIHRDLVIKAGNWNIQLTVNDDAEFIARILLESEILINTDGCYVLYCDHKESRISKKNNIKGLVSFLLSLRLMHANLKAYDITCKPYFKWKLFNIFYNNWKTNKDVLINHKFFFKENGIDFRYSRYYMIKYSIYKIVYPWYKNKFKNK